MAAECVVTAVAEVSRLYRVSCIVFVCVALLPTGTQQDGVLVRHTSRQRRYDCRCTRHVEADLC